MLAYGGGSVIDCCKVIAARPALAWAHQKGLVLAEGRLGPRDAVPSAEAERMMGALSK